MTEPKKVGTWVLACTPGGELIKWGKDGDTVYPFPPDDKDAVACAMNIAHDEAHKDDRLYILHVFDNGQMKQYEFDADEVPKSWDHPDPELKAVALSLEQTGEAEYKGFKIYPAPEYGYEVQGDDEHYETLPAVLNAINDRILS